MGDTADLTQARMLAAGMLDALSETEKLASGALPKPLDNTINVLAALRGVVNGFADCGHNTEETMLALGLLVITLADSSSASAAESFRGAIDASLARCEDLPQEQEIVFSLDTSNKKKTLH